MQIISKSKNYDGTIMSFMHLAPRRADYEQAFTGVNLKTDIISGALFNISGTLFRAPETIKISGALFRQFGPIY